MNAVKAVSKFATSDGWRFVLLEQAKEWADTRTREDSWCGRTPFSESAEDRQLVRALRCASRIPVLRSDPDRALRRAERLPTIKVTDTITLNRLSPSEKQTLGTVLAIAKRVYPNACHKDAIIACLDRFVNLVKEGRAGTGWDSSPIDIPAPMS